MINLDKYKEEIQGIMASLKVDDYHIELVPGEVMNNEKMVDTIYVLIEHKATKKRGDYMYRHGHHDLKQFLKSAVQDFETKIVKEVLNPKQTNSL